MLNMNSVLGIAHVSWVCKVHALGPKKVSNGG